MQSAVNNSASKLNIEHNRDYSKEISLENNTELKTEPLVEREGKNYGIDNLEEKT